MKVIKTDNKQYPVCIKDSWGGVVDLTPGDIPRLIKELQKIVKESKEGSK